MQDLRIVADGNQGGVAGYASIPYYVRNDGAIKSVADLKGKHLVANALGGAADFGLRAVLQKHGLVDKRDYTLTESAFPTLIGLLLGGKADLVAMRALRLRSRVEGARRMFFLRWKASLVRFSS